MSDNETEKIATELGELSFNDVKAEREERRLKQSTLLASKKRESEAKDAINKQIAALQAQLAVNADNKQRLEEQLKTHSKRLKIKRSDGGFDIMVSPKPGEKERAYFKAAGAAVKSKKDKGDNCPICCEALEGELSKCETRCRTQYHAKCVTDWRAFCDEKKMQMRCTVCRRNWAGAPVVEAVGAPAEPLEIGECEVCGAPTPAALRLCDFCERADRDDSDDEDHDDEDNCEECGWSILDSRHIDNCWYYCCENAETEAENNA